MSKYQLKSVTSAKTRRHFRNKEQLIAFAEEDMTKTLNGETLESFARLEPILDHNGNILRYAKTLTLEQKFEIAVAYIRTQSRRFKIHRLPE